MSIVTDRTRVKNVAKYLELQSPAELDTMSQRHAAARAVTLTVTVPDLTSTPPDDIPAAINAACTGSDDVLNRARALAMKQFEAAYHSLAVDWLRSQLPAVAAKFNAAASEFERAYDPTVLLGWTVNDVDPRALNGAALVVYGRAKDAHDALVAAVQIAMQEIATTQGMSWERRMALTIDGAYQDVSDLATVHRDSPSALFGYYGIAIRSKGRVDDVHPRAEFRAFAPGPLRINMPETYDDYVERLGRYTAED